MKKETMIDDKTKVEEADHAEALTRQKRKIQKRIQIAIGSVTFVVAYLLSWNFLCQPLTDEQFGLCEQVAQDVVKYLPDTVSSSDLYVNVTDDFSVHVTTGKNFVNVTSQGFYHRDDKVVGKLKNDTFIIERKNGIASAIFISILFGIAFFIIGYAIGKFLSKYFL